MTAPASPRAGAVWTGASSLAIRATTFVTGIVVARLVAPEQVGVFVVALTVQVIVISASELGMGSAIARMTDGVDRAGPTAVTLAVTSSAVLTAALFLASGGIATWFGVPEATWPLRVMSLTILCAGLATVANGLLLREFAGKQRFVAESGNTAVGTAVLIVLLLVGWGAMALAVGRLAGQLTSTIALLLLAPRRYRPGFNRAQARRLIGFGLPLVGASTLGFATVNVDNVAVGRIAGPAQLGPYALAFNVASWPFTIFTSMINAVALPAFAQVDGVDLRRRVRRTLEAVAAVTVPAGALLATLAEPLVLALYGSAWTVAVAPLAVLAGLGVIRAPMDVLGNLIIARGHTRVFLAMQAVVLICTVLAMPTFVLSWGAVGAAWALGLISVAVVGPLVLLVSVRLLGMPLRMIAGAVARPFLAAPAVVAVAWGVAHVLGGGLSPWLVLLFAGTAGAAAYVALLGRWLIGLARSHGVTFPGSVVLRGGPP